MPRALWSGAISFGLVNAPVRMYTAISEHDVHFHLLHAKNGARIHYKKVTDSHPRDIPDDQIVKGYEVADGGYVTLTDEEIAAAHVEGDKVIERQEAQGRDDHGSGGRGAPRARRPHGGARGEPRGSGRQARQGPEEEGACGQADARQGQEVAQQGVSGAAMLRRGHG